MKIGISVSIDVTKIDKARLYQGKKGTYLDLTTFIDTDNADQYQNHGFISQSQTKEERDAGAERTPILGNCKVFYTDAPSQQQQAQHNAGMAQAQQAAAPANNDQFGAMEDDIPFANIELRTF